MAHKEQGVSEDGDGPPLSPLDGATARLSELSLGPVHTTQRETSEHVDNTSLKPWNDSLIRENLQTWGVGKTLAVALEPKYVEDSGEVAINNFQTWGTQTFSPAVSDPETFALFCQTWEEHRHSAKEDIRTIISFVVAFEKEKGWSAELASATSAEAATNYQRLLDAVHQVSEQLCQRKGAEGQPDVWAKDTCRYLLYVLKQGQTDHPEMRHMLLYLITVIDSLKAALEVDAAGQVAIKDEETGLPKVV